MPHIKVNNCSIYYEDSELQGVDNGANKSAGNVSESTGKPVMMFAHGLLWSTRLYDAQVAYFKDRYRCIAFDFRGQGQSEVTKSGYDMDTLTDDTMALMAALGIDKCHFVGLSMGGFIGQRIAIHRPDLLESLILLETSADPEQEENVPKYSKLLTAIRWLGMKRVSKKVMPIMFGQSFLNDKSRRAENKYWLEQLNQNDKKGIIEATKGVIYRKGVYDRLGFIDTPTLILVGDEDVATPYAKAERLHFAIRNSKLALIAGAGHTSAAEAPEQVNAVIERFLTQQVF